MLLSSGERGGADEEIPDIRPSAVPPPGEDEPFAGDRHRAGLLEALLPPIRPPTEASTPSKSNGSVMLVEI